MNRLLIVILDFLNKLVAVVLIVSSTVSGWYGEFGFFEAPVADPAHRAVATATGFVVGIALAAVVSGVLATFITISREMTAIRELLRERPLATR